MITIGKEFEAKFSMTKRGHARVKSMGFLVKSIEQLNVYYDNNWKLAEKSGTFRIRLSPASEAMVTLKLKRSQHGVTRIADELELPAQELRRHRNSNILHPKTIDVSKDLPQRLARHLKAEGIRHLHRVGWMRNTRHVIQFSPLGAVELDCTRLPSKEICYEAEIENPDSDIRLQLAEIVQRLAPDSQPSSLSKFQRFREALSKLHAGRPPKNRMR